MGSAGNKPKWWTESHGSQWDNLRDALQRDWEQTKKDLHAGGTELNQSIGNTLKQAAGGEAIPWSYAPAAEGSDHSWANAEQSLMYGVGARHQYGAQHAVWDEKLEAMLKTDWESMDGPQNQKWDDVKALVRHGYARAHLIP